MKEVPYIRYQNNLSFKNKFYRLIWNLFYKLLFKPFCGPFLSNYRVFVLRLFGAKIGNGCKIKSSVNIWSPNNLIVGNYVAIGDNVILYNPEKIIIGNRVTISQFSHLCSASHDITKIHNPLVTGEIVIHDLVWIATDVFVGLGVNIEEGCVVGARSSVFKDLKSWRVYGGSPAKEIKHRKIS